MHVALLVILVSVGAAPAYADEIPQWVSDSITLWNNGEISNQEFVNAIDYLVDKEIIQIALPENKELLRDIQYLKAKNEVINEEVKELRDENKEYRILLKNSEIGTSLSQMSSYFDDYTELKKEVHVLRELNKQYTKQIDAYVSSSPELLEANTKLIEGIEQEYQDKINKLELEKSKDQMKINELLIEIGSYQKKLQEISLESTDDNSMIQQLQHENQQMKMQVEELSKDNQLYQAQISSIESENVVQDTERTEYVGLLNQKIQQLTQDKVQLINSLEQSKNVNSKELQVTNSLNEQIKTEQEKIFTLEKEIQRSDGLIDALYLQIDKYDDTIVKLEEINEDYQNTINQLMAEEEIPEPELIQNDVENIIDEEVYMVEINYLKAKNLVNEEEIQVLRSENEEYRTMLNLLKKGNDITGLNNINYKTVHTQESNIQGATIFNGFIESPKPAEVRIYVEPTPSWSTDVSKYVDAAIDYWTQRSDTKISLVPSPNLDTVIIKWHKDSIREFDGMVIDNKIMKIGLGSADCDGKWRAFDAESVTKLVTHELGHVLGYGHSEDETNIMYPMIHGGKFVPVSKNFSLQAGEAVFVAGCSFSPEPSYKYKVATDGNDPIDMFFVPSSAEKTKYEKGEEFKYHSDIDCIGINRTMQSGICKNVADTSGIMVIAPETIKGNQILVEIYLEQINK